MEKYKIEEVTETISRKKEIPISLICDKCKKEILNEEDYKEPSKNFILVNKVYYYITTHHNDWGNDSVDSYEYSDICEDCLVDFVKEYFKSANGTEQCEIERIGRTYRESRKENGK